eukprot:353038-Chlamydomonas_euryale.AAC.1
MQIWTCSRRLDAMRRVAVRHAAWSCWHATKRDATCTAPLSMFCGCGSPPALAHAGFPTILLLNPTSRLSPKPRRWFHPPPLLLCQHHRESAHQLRNQPLWLHAPFAHTNTNDKQAWELEASAPGAPPMDIKKQMEAWGIKYKEALARVGRAGWRLVSGAGGHAACSASWWCCCVGGGHEVIKCAGSGQRL